MPDRGELCLRLTGAASRSTVSREVLNANRQSAMPTTARTSVVMVSERWRFSDRVICGDTTTDSAMIAPAAPSESPPGTENNATLNSISGGPPNRRQGRNRPHRVVVLSTI